MKIYLLDDDMAVTNILERIINHKNLGDIIGISNDPLEALDQILLKKPDIVITDLLMPEIDGIRLVKETAEESEAQYIMISQVSNKDMVARAYQAGIEYFISKPINAIEVETVIKKVTDKINKEDKLRQIENLFVQPTDTSPLSKEDQARDRLERVLKRIGIIGETGTPDIIQVVEYCLRQDLNLSQETMKTILENFDSKSKSMEQRMRRTAYTGLVNLANLGLEDYMNEVFTEYSSVLYNFDQVRKEMNYIRGKGESQGKVNLKKFIEGLVFCSKE